jgi:hypothetical protein
MSIRLRIGQRRSLTRIYAGTEVKGSLASVKTAWGDPIGEEWGGFLPEALTLANYGAGEVPAGTREIQFRGPSQVAARHGLEVIRGPEAGTRWRVLSVDTSDPRTAKVRIEPFNGAFA